MKTIIIEWQDWISSPLSIARHNGGVTIGESEYYVIGELQDLVRKDLISFFKRLGRSTFISILRAHLAEDDKVIKLAMMNAINEKKEEEQRKIEEEQRKIEEFEKRQTTLEL